MPVPSDQTPAVAFQGGGQPPVQTPPPAEPAKEPAQPEVLTLTKDEFENRLSAVKKEAEDAAFKRAQSLIEKTNTTVLKKVQADLKNLQQSLELQRKAGIEISPQQEEALKTQVISKAFTEGDPLPEPEPPPQPAQPAPGQVPGQPPRPGAEPELDPITAEAQRMMQEAGTTIDAGDPELALLNHSSPYQYLRSIEAAIAAKRQRLSSSKTPTNLGGMGVHNPNRIQDIKDPHELFKLAGIGGS